MELVHAHQITIEELLCESIDVLVAACGSDSRSSHLIQLSSFNANKKIALLFRENQNQPLYKSGEQVFKDKGFECFEMSGDSSGEIMAVLDTITDYCKCENIKLVVDYSSMTKMWYGTIINYFVFNELKYNNLVVYFCYTPEHFVPPAALKGKLPKPEPLFINRPAVNENKPIALVIGLSHAEMTAEFLCDFFKPEDVYFFLPSPSFDDNYTQLARSNNRKILANVRSTHLLPYSAKNIEEIDSKLTSLCLNLRLKYRIILISLGPKTFSLASLLLNARYPDIEIWSLFSSQHTFDLKPSGAPIVYKAVLTNEE
jgi:hypothetical protein